MIKKGVVRKKKMQAYLKKLNSAAVTVLYDGHTLILGFALCKI